MLLQERPDSCSGHRTALESKRPLSVLFVHTCVFRANECCDDDIVHALSLSWGLLVVYAGLLICRVAFSLDIDASNHFVQAGEGIRIQLEFRTTDVFL